MDRDRDFWDGCADYWVESRESLEAFFTGYILRAIGRDPCDVLAEFLAMAGMSPERVTHQVASPRRPEAGAQ
ncbi:hypothetical protein [Streptomyces sp. NPDC019937]|uniref:hypothetical protein n=1 Tax=Streptomyces sp. NPDC019937 TaxID=3154787 RepID=UPI0033EA3F25